MSAAASPLAVAASLARRRCVGYAGRPPAPRHGASRCGRRADTSTASYCAACHGASAPASRHRGGRGGAAARAGRAAWPRALAARRRARALPTSTCAPATCRSRTSARSPRRERRVRLQRAQIRRLDRYVASLGTGPAIPTPHPESGNVSRGMHLFTDHCAGCHQIAAARRLCHRALVPPLAAGRDAPADRARRCGIGPVRDAALLAAGI